MIEIQIRRPCRKPGEKVVGIALHCIECGAHTYYDYPDRIDHKTITEWVSLSSLAEIHPAGDRAGRCQVKSDPLPPYRTGTKLGTTIYRVGEDEPCAWVPRDRELAARIVALLNKDALDGANV